MESDKVRWHFPHIFNVNARSLNNEKLDELHVLVSDFNVSVVCVTETWFKEYMDDSNVAINGFYCERKDGLDKRAGGVACYLKHNL